MMKVPGSGAQKCSESGGLALCATLGLLRPLRKGNFVAEANISLKRSGPILHHVDAVAIWIKERKPLDAASVPQWRDVYA